MKQNYTVTSDLKVVEHGLVDYIAEGIYNNQIPCQVGFMEFGDGELEATHIFIRDGILEDGTCYNAETIEL